MYTYVPGCILSMRLIGSREESEAVMAALDVRNKLNKRLQDSHIYHSRSPSPTDNVMERQAKSHTRKPDLRSRLSRRNDW